MSALRSGLLNNEITRNKFVWLAILICTGCMALVYAISQLRMVLNLVMLSRQVWIVCLLAATLPLLLVQLFKGIYLLGHASTRKTAVVNIPSANSL